MSSFSILIILSVLCGRRALSTEIPKNVILVVAKGMSSEAVTSARIEEDKNLQRNGSYVLSFEKFPHQGTLKTYYDDFKPGDSLSSASALFRGTYDPASNSCNDTFLNEEESIISFAQRNNKATGLVTTMGLTAPLPATLYGVGPGSGAEECPQFAKSNCSDTSHFLVHGRTGNNMDVIFGDGSGLFGVEDNEVKSDEKGCYRSDGRNLIEEWKSGDPLRVFINGTEEFEKHNITGGEKIIGTFSDLDLQKFNRKDKTEKNYLNKIVTKAIKILKLNTNGYLLVVIADSEDVGDTVVMVSHLMDAIMKVSSGKDTLLITTSDYVNGVNHCSTVGDQNLPEKVNLVDKSSTETNTVKMDEVTNTAGIERNTTTSETPSTLPPIISHSNDCSKNTHFDVPIYVKGPHSGSMPLVQDQAVIGGELRKLIEAKKRSLSNLPSEIDRELISGKSVKIDSDMFQSDIKEALAEIDDMAMDFFDDLLSNE